ncbi:hypothetical protein [Parapedobacter sp. DT-150]|uniref:hypothetical protein n=1 Tax=Parapedobacter sp. DT-150 TaxID=3396162 RepID=UPI003F1A6E72
MNIFRPFVVVNFRILREAANTQYWVFMCFHYPPENRLESAVSGMSAGWQPITADDEPDSIVVLQLLIAGRKKTILWPVLFPAIVRLSR